MHSSLTVFAVSCALDLMMKELLQTYTFIEKLQSKLILMTLLQLFL